MLETAAQPALEIQIADQLLKHDQPGKRAQLLILESQLGQASEFTTDVRFAMFHRSGWVVVNMFFAHSLYLNPTRTLSQNQQKIRCTETSLTVRSQYMCQFHRIC